MTDKVNNNDDVSIVDFTQTLIGNIPTDKLKNPDLLPFLLPPPIGPLLPAFHSPVGQFLKNLGEKATDYIKDKLEQEFNPRRVD
jgi:hypothetical protein